jgi:hypothetical protein
MGKRMVAIEIRGGMTRNNQMGPLTNLTINWLQLYLRQ